MFLPRRSHAARGGALTFDATVALLLTYEERLRRREHEGDRLALAETAEEMARIAVEQDREDTAGFLKAAAVNENLPDAQVERMLPLLHESVHHKVASDAESRFPDLVTRLLVRWWEGSGRTDRRAARAALAHAEATLATLAGDSPRLVPALPTIGILLQHRYAEETGSLADLRQAAVCFRRITELSAPDSADHRDAAAHLMACRLASPRSGPVLDLVHPGDFDEPDPRADPTEVLAPPGPAGRVLGRTLPEIAPPGVDILLNPGDRAQFRLPAEGLRR
ncbi:hypothetical protein ABT174_18530 [Streptomyces sparsogenes]|uniref:hypothetical protein n=1 Tax=Streptomyces sparsogenes TaxID=67365 RepID=UPI003325A8B5